MIKEKSHIWAQISRQLGVLFANFSLPPNFYTWSTLPLAFLGLFCIKMGWVWSGVIFFTLAGILDLVDGAVARHLNCTSNRGAFLDGSLDRFIDFLLIYSYFWLPIQLPWFPLGQWLGIAIFFAIMPSYEVAYANHRRAVQDPNETMIWRILNRGEMYLLMLLIPIFSIYRPDWAGYLLMAFVLLAIITTLQTLLMTLYFANKPTSS